MWPKCLPAAETVARNCFPAGLQLTAPLEEHFWMFGLIWFLHARYHQSNDNTLPSTSFNFPELARRCGVRRSRHWVEKTDINQNIPTIGSSLLPSRPGAGASCEKSEQHAFHR
jgi:hypothetical protein